MKRSPDLRDSGMPGTPSAGTWRSAARRSGRRGPATPVRSTPAWGHLGRALLRCLPPVTVGEGRPLRWWFGPARGRDGWDRCGYGSWLVFGGLWCGEAEVGVWAEPAGRVAVRSDVAPAAELVPADQVTAGAALRRLWLGGGACSWGCAAHCPVRVKVAESARDGLCVATTSGIVGHHLRRVRRRSGCWLVEIRRGFDEWRSVRAPSAC